MRGLDAMRPVGRIYYEGRTRWVSPRLIMVQEGKGAVKCRLDFDLIASGYET